jgi:LEM3 (ligand-effect modulator 3) family / CDC50 family
MSIAGLPTFKKLWGKIETDLPKGLYTVTIQNNYDVSKFSGTKSFVITTTSNLGGKMSFLGIIYLVVGCISLIGGLVILSLTNYMKNRRIIGNI